MTRSDCVLQCFCCVQLRLEGIKLWPLHVHISIALFFNFSNFCIYIILRGRVWVGAGVDINEARLIGI